METTPSARRITRSQAAASAEKELFLLDAEKSGKQEISHWRSSRKEEGRAVLLDITNDSPIVRLATAKSLDAEKDQQISRPRSSRMDEARAMLLDIANDSPIVGLATGPLSAATAESLNAEDQQISLLKPSRKDEARAMLLDIANESPIVGLATGPLSAATAKSLDGEKGQEISHPRSSMKDEACAALLDITNDSPIVGLATGSLSAPTAKNLDGIWETIGSGEEALRSMVRKLLLETEKESELVKEGDDQFDQIAEALNPEKSPGLINPALLMFDSPDKSDIFSSLNFQCKGESSSLDEQSSEDDNSSVWSTQVNASSDIDFDGIEAEEEQDGVDKGMLGGDGLMVSMVDDEKARLPEEEHIWFGYKSEDEMEEEEKIKKAASLSVPVLDVPAPEAQHRRFQEEGDEQAAAED